MVEPNFDWLLDPPDSTTVPIGTNSEVTHPITSPPIHAATFYLTCGASARYIVQLQKNEEVMRLYYSVLEIAVHLDLDRYIEALLTRSEGGSPEGLAVRDILVNDSAHAAT